MLKNINIITEDIMQDMESNELILCNDGSCYENSSGGGWVLATKNIKIIATGYNQDTAYKEYQHSYRSETQSNLEGHLFINEICNFYAIDIPKVINICDCESLLKKFQSHRPLKQNEAAVDVLKEIKKVIEQKPIIYRYVRGHQDEQVKILSD